MMISGKKYSYVVLLVVSITIFFVALCSTSMGAASQNYYVSTTTGNDNNNGLTLQTPWRTLSKVNGAVLRPGDKVLFKRGDEWRGQLVPKSGSAGAPITYGAYGSGTKPLLLGSVSRNNTQVWQYEGSNIWATIKPAFRDDKTQADFLSRPWTLSAEAGAQSRMTSLEGNGKYTLKITSVISGTAPNHIQLYNHGLFIRDGDYFVFTFRARGTKPFTIHNIKLIKQSAPWTTYGDGGQTNLKITSDWTDYSMRFKASQTAPDGRITIYLGGAVPPESEFYFQPVEWKKVESVNPEVLSLDVGNIIFDHGKSVGIKKWKQDDLKRQGDFWYNADTWQVKLNSEKNPAEWYKSIELALARTIVKQGGKSYIVYENLALQYGAAHGIGGGDTHHIVIRDCDISWIGGGHQFTRANGAPVRFGNGIEFWSNAHDNLVEDCRIWEIYDAAMTNQGSDVNVQSDITYRNNVIWNSEYSFEYWNGPHGSKTQNIRFEHNTCVNAGFGWGHAQRSIPNGHHLMFFTNQAKTDEFNVRDNIFYNATESLLSMSNNWTAALTMDNNSWFQSRGDLIRFLKASYGSNQFTQFQEQANQDKHSMFADPKFVDINKLDFRLSANSPVRSLSIDGGPVGSLKRLQK
ncbi:MAG: right-handed parallel beta-helix repeat-containing protein [Proteobacteria bacterium]|nr:right-handed parallel beta-helix repeat-containing protein [Pseudomonadota bacterium]